MLADRGFDSNAFLQAVAGTKAQFLIRAKSGREQQWNGQWRYQGV